LKPPTARKIPHDTPIHGQTLKDDYFWLREKSNPEVIRHLESENAYTEAVMEPTRALQESLYTEMLGRIKQTDLTVPYRLGGFYYYSRTEEGKQYPYQCRRAGSMQGDEQILLDINELAEGHSFLGLGSFRVSDDGNWLAYSTDTTGYRQYTLYVKDLRTGRLSTEHIERTTSVVWASDNRTLFYTTEDPVSKRSDRFWRHLVGSEHSDVLFDEKDELFDVDVSRSLDLRWTTTAARSTSPRTRARRLFASNVTFFSGHAVVSEREGGLRQLRVIDMKTRQSHRIAADEADHAMALENNREAETVAVRFTYQSTVTPPTVYDYDMTTKRTTLLKRQEVLDGYNPGQYEAVRIWATARDGTRAPISLVYKKGVRLDAQAPMLLSAYGSYGVSQAPTFNASRVSLLDRGVVYALAYIRGGGELGEDWREQGRMMKKLNTFYDFIDCADFLIRNKYTSRDRLVIQGGSAGGLLMGAVVNMRPDLFKAVVAQVPFVDVMNSMLDASLPLTTSEYIKWGNPNEKPAFDYMMQYSPYDNVKPQNYPAMLVQVSLNDSQVPYWEGAKWVARLRATRTDSNMLLPESEHGRRPWWRVGPLRRTPRDSIHLFVRAPAAGADEPLVARSFLGRRYCTTSS
jgi:oligopeptidase B